MSIVDLNYNAYIKNGILLLNEIYKSASAGLGMGFFKYVQFCSARLKPSFANDYRIRAEIWYNSNQSY